MASSPNNDPTPFFFTGKERRDLVADTIGGKSLSRVLAALPASEIAPGVFYDTANARTANHHVRHNPFLQELSARLLAETKERLTITPKNARALGISVCSSTLETTAREHGSRAVDAFADDALGRTFNGSINPEGLVMWPEALHVVDSDARMRLAVAMMNELDEKVMRFPLREAAGHADVFINRLGRQEAIDAASLYIPWEIAITDAEDDATAVNDIFARSQFAGSMLDMASGELSGRSYRSPEDGYREGVQRTLAFVALGTSRMASQ